MVDNGSNPKNNATQVKKVIRVVAAVIRDGDRYLITQRQQKAVLPGLWEFPGGKADPSESDHQALKREISERLQVGIDIGEQLTSRDHEYEHYTVSLKLYSASLSGGTPKKGNIEQYRWVRSSEMNAYEFPPADQASMDALLGLADED